MKTGIILGLLVLVLITGFVVLKPEKEREGGKISFEEKQLVEAWILANDLNQYGDAKDMIYTGGTPLFDERTGKTIDKYEYVLENNPDRPWKK